jgi:hypothetical protein
MQLLNSPAEKAGEKERQQMSYESGWFSPEASDRVLGSWRCNVCNAENDRYDSECQFCECGGLVCERDSCSGDFCKGFQNLAFEIHFALDEGVRALTRGLRKSVGYVNYHQTVSMQEGD